jgi:hypothetical protein
MLDKARAIGPEDITYVRADVTPAPRLVDGRPFAGCTCELALMDIDDLAGTLSTVTTALRPGGWFGRKPYGAAAAARGTPGDRPPAVPDRIPLPCPPV